MLLLSQDYGKHLLGVEDLLQKHALVEADIAIQSDRVKAVNANASKYSVNNNGKLLPVTFQQLNFKVFLHFSVVHIFTLLPNMVCCWSSFTLRRLTTEHFSLWTFVTAVLKLTEFLPVQATSHVIPRSSRTGCPTWSSATRS